MATVKRLRNKTDMEDRLETIFKNQQHLQERMGNPMGTGEDGVYHNMMALINETSEVMNEINWKRWKKDFPEYKQVDMEKLLVELCDILQFWVNACHCMGFDDDDVFRALVGKWTENHQRVTEGY